MYHQLIYLLDLCTYSYQLHNQTLIWPMDPYYDQFSGIKGRRNGFMAEVHKYALPVPHYLPAWPWLSHYSRLITNKTWIPYFLTITKSTHGTLVP